MLWISNGINKQATNINQVNINKCQPSSWQSQVTNQSFVKLIKTIQNSSYYDFRTLASRSLWRLFRRSAMDHYCSSCLMMLDYLVWMNFDPLLVDICWSIVIDLELIWLILLVLCQEIRLWRVRFRGHINDDESLWLVITLWCLKPKFKKHDDCFEKKMAIKRNLRHIQSTIAETPISVWENLLNLNCATSWIRTFGRPSTTTTKNNHNNNPNPKKAFSQFLFLGKPNGSQPTGRINTKHFRWSIVSRLRATHTFKYRKICPTWKIIFKPGAFEPFERIHKGEIFYKHQNDQQKTHLIQVKPAPLFQIFPTCQTTYNTLLPPSMVPHQTDVASGSQVLWVHSPDPMFWRFCHDQTSILQILHLRCLELW